MADSANKQPKNSNFEKLTNTILGNEEGIIPSSVKQLSVSLDIYFQGSEELALERHEQILKAITEYKELNTKTCEACQKINTSKFTGVDKKFEKIKYITFFSENPKLALVLLISTIVLVISGADSLIVKLSTILRL